MKTRNIYGILIMAALFLTACSEKKTQEQAFMTPVQDSVTVEWTAYKTTDKLPVKGEFTTVNLDSYGQGSTVISVLDGAEFTINAMELVTGDESRDIKIKESFFGLMNEPGKITGEFMQSGNEWFVKLKMNGVSVEKLPAKVEITDNTAQITASIQLADFKALEVLEALNKACYDLHIGGDGISKTWDVVDISASVSFERAD